MVGLLDDVTRTVGLHFAREGDIVALLGTTRDEMGASEYLATVLGRDEGPCPALDLASTRALVNLLLETVRDGMLSSAHDVSEGGLAVALAEAAMGPAGLGADVNVTTPLPATRLLFSQTAGRAVVSMPAGRERNLVEAGRRTGSRFRSWAASCRAASPCPSTARGSRSRDGRSEVRVRIRFLKLVEA